MLLQSSSCTYLQAFLQEALRKYPVIGGVPGRNLLPNGTQVQGRTRSFLLPASTSVGMGIYSLQHHPDYVPDPLIFQTERWLENDVDHDRLCRARRALNSFPYGQATWLGQDLAIAELMLAPGTILTRFDLRSLTENWHNWRRHQHK